MPQTFDEAVNTLQNMIQKNTKDIEDDFKEFWTSYGGDEDDAITSTETWEKVKDKSLELAGEEKRIFDQRAKDMKDFLDKTGHLAVSAFWASSKNALPGLQETLGKELFIEATGVTNDFFDKYIKGSNIIQAINNGTIKTNEDLITVIKAEVDQKGFLNMKTIEGLVLKNKETNLNKNLTDTSVNLTDSQQLQADAYDTLKKAQAGTLQSQIDVLDSQITLLQGDGELINSKGEVIKLTEAEVAAIQILIDKKNELQNQAKKESYANKIISDERLRQMSQFGNAIATIAGENKELAIAGMRISQFAATVSAIEGGIRLFGDSGNWVEALVATAVALAQVATIEAQIQGARGVSVGGSSSGKFAYGGLVGGNRHLDGGTLIEAEQGEFVMSRKAVQSIGLKGLNELNRGGSSGGINVTVTGNVLTQDFVEGELAESIKEAVRRGSDFGIG